MAPKGGGKGGGGGSSGKGSGSSSSCTIANPCSSELQYMYGFSYTSLYTNTELYAQAIIYAIWMLALIGCYLYLRKIQALSTRLAVLAFTVCFAFLVVRFGLLIGDVNVPLGYRHEASIVVLFWRLGMPLLFIAVCGELDLGKLTKLASIIGVSLYAIFNLTYIILDFLISAQAVDHFKAEKEWWLSDRDFGLTYDSSMIKKLKITARGGNDGLSPRYLRDRLFDLSASKFLHDRGLVIKIGLTADFIALALAGFVVAMAALRFVRRKSTFVENPMLLLVAGSGLLITTFFRVVVATHYVLHNWGVVTNVDKWSEWIDTYTSLDATTGIIPPEGFLNGYRVTVTGFPIVQAILEPLGIVVACAAIVLVVVRTRKGLAVNNGEVKV